MRRIDNIRALLNAVGDLLNLGPMITKDTTDEDFVNLLVADWFNTTGEEVSSEFFYQWLYEDDDLL